MMTGKITLEQHRDELRAEYRASSDRKELRQIFDELWLCDLMLTALTWQADNEARQQK
jgi:hypothetical protein